MRGWIAAHEQDLEAGLADLGLQLDELVVREDESREQSPEHEQQSQQQSRRKRSLEETDTFEVRV